MSEQDDLVEQQFHTPSVARQVPVSTSQVMVTGELGKRLEDAGGIRDHWDNVDGRIPWVNAPLDYVEAQSIKAHGNRMQQQVRTFHEKFNNPVGVFPHALPQHRVPVRVELIREEFEDELIPALEAGDIIETIDAAIDILYVTFGLLVEMGVDAQPFFDEVQRSNMSKLGADGEAIIAQVNDPDGIFPGRVKKGPNYFRPNLAGVLEEQLKFI